MREIEVKARVKDSRALLAALKKHHVSLGDLTEQHDRVYARPGAIDNDPKENWLRIRTENHQTSFFTLKRSVTSELDSIEHETEIANPDELAKIIAHLGYEPYAEVIKTRQKAHLDDIEICLDNVDKLGLFIEAEKLTDEDADAAAVEKELWDILEPLGVSKDDAVDQGYDVLMREQFGKPEESEPETHTTLLFLIRDNKILLGTKKRGFGAGRLAGIGGKVKNGETAEQAASRETLEEVDVTPTYFSKVAELSFHEWIKGRREHVITDVFLCEEWQGEASESDEMIPEWVACDELPFNKMWPDSQFWLPQVIAGEHVKGDFEYDEHDALLKHNVSIVASF